MKVAERALRYQLKIRKKGMTSPTDMYRKLHTYGNVTRVSKTRDAKSLSPSLADRSMWCAKIYVQESHKVEDVDVFEELDNMLREAAEECGDVEYVGFEVTPQNSQPHTLQGYVYFNLKKESKE